MNGDFDNLYGVYQQIGDVLHGAKEQEEGRKTAIEQSLNVLAPIWELKASDDPAAMDLHFTLLGIHGVLLWALPGGEQEQKLATDKALAVLAEVE